MPRPQSGSCAHLLSSPSWSSRGFQRPERTSGKVCSRHPVGLWLAKLAVSGRIETWKLGTPAGLAPGVFCLGHLDHSPLPCGLSQSYRI